MTVEKRKELFISELSILGGHKSVMQFIIIIIIFILLKVIITPRIIK